MRENTTAGLHSTNWGSSHVPHVRCKPERIIRGGTWWRVYSVQRTQAVSKHTHTHTNIQELEPDIRVQLVNQFSFRIYTKYTKFLASSVFPLVNSLVTEQPDVTLAYWATLVTPTVCCYCSRLSSCCLPSDQG